VLKTQHLSFFSCTCCNSFVRVWRGSGVSGYLGVAISLVKRNYLWGNGLAIEFSFKMSYLLNWGFILRVDAVNFGALHEVQYNCTNDKKLLNGLLWQQ